MAYEFHYTPTGTGVISGKEVLEQTEDAINDLGNTAISGVQEALDKAEQALTNSENAVDDAQTALNTANNAEGVAIQAQNDVSNLSGTVTNIGNRVTTAEGNITNLQGRMTTAEGNITNLQGRMTTAEGNIGNLQTAVSTAQATANSAQQTATTARQQSYVFRYSSTALVASSTNSNTLLDNTDNLKVGDKVIDSSGVLFSITAIDTQNSTFTIGTALVDLATDSDVVHKSGNETISGFKEFANIRATNSIKAINLENTTTDLNNCYSDFAFSDGSRAGNIQYYYCNTDSGTANISNLPEAKAFFLTSITTRLLSNSLYVKQILINSNSKTFVRYCNNSTWSSWVNETDSEYVHKSGNETIGGVKTFSDNPVIGSNNANITVSNRQITANGSYPTPTGNSYSYMQLKAVVNYTDSSPSIDATVSLSVQENAYSDGKNRSFSPSANNVIDLGLPGKRWANVYATNYYYGSNNIEFSTKFVTTDTNQTIGGTKDFSDVLRIYNSNASSNTAQLWLKNSKVNRGQAVHGDQTVWFRDAIDKPVTALVSRVTSTGASAFLIQVYNIDQDNQQVSNYLSFVKNLDGTCYLLPDQNDVIVLGSSLAKFKSVNTNKINGVEPGALSLPSGDASNFIDISSYFSNTGTGGTNSYTASANGWIYLRLGDISGCQATILDANNNRMWGQSLMGNVEQLTIPILKGQTLSTQWNTSSTVYVAIARFIPCQGNV